MICYPEASNVINNYNLQKVYQSRMGGRTRNSILGVVFFFLLFPSVALPQQVKLKFIVMNSSESESKDVPVKYFLPPGVKPENILDSSGLNVAYDIEARKYCVSGAIKLGPKETHTYELKVQDIWRIPDDKLNSLGQYADGRLKILEKNKSYAIAKNIKDSISARLEAISVNQATPKSIAKRVEEYYVNKNSLGVIEKDVFTLDQLVLEAQSGVEKKTANIKVEVKNPSDTDSREIPVKYYLPPEVTLADVKDTAGFDVRYDNDRQQVYLEKTMEFEPGETKSFEVKVNDIWDSGQFEYEMKSVEAEADKINDQLVDTPSQDVGEELGKQIKQFTELIRSSSRENVSLKDRIADYRENVNRMEMVKDCQKRLRDLIFKFQMARAGDKGEIPSVGDKGAQESNTKDDKVEAKDEFGAGRENKSEGGGLGRGISSAPVEAKTQPNLHRGGGIPAIRGLKGIILVSKSIFKGWEPKIASTWLIILYMIIFLGLFSGLFYILWWMQSKKITKRKPLVK